MSQRNEGPEKTFPPGAALGQHLRVKLSGGKLALAGSTDVEIGTMRAPAYGDLDPPLSSVIVRTAQGTVQMIANDAIESGNPVYAAANGRVASSGTVLVGLALHSTTLAGDVIEVLRRQESSDFAASGGTTAAAFLVDSDATTPKIELAGQTGGTGDYKATIKPPENLGDDRVYTLPVDGNARLLSDYRQICTADDAEGAGNTILPGVTSVVVDGVTNDAGDFVVLPPLADVEDGHVIRIYGEADSNFEVRTPADSDEEINSENCDGTKEYLFTKLQLHTFIKLNDTIGWVAHGITALGAAVTPVVPD